MRSKNLCKRIGMLFLAAVVSLVTSAQVWAQQTITGPSSTRQENPSWVQPCW